MSGIYLFGLASRRAQYLSVRQATVAGNIANADTPGYKARDVVPFAEVLSRAGLDLAATSQGHLRAGTTTPTAKVKPSESWDAIQGGHSVSLEQEMLKSNDIARDFNLNTAVVKAFHRMMLSGVRSGS
ncbi:flagellar basal body rod protein [Methylobacterium sp. 4-46]|uniref:flagellar basal body rod protein FlgB n=1 Tax=unclassified Methylobacterium TaxID=2615210 RepID=UPI000152DB6D|nr:MULTISPECIES: flagellar basal body rod protein FlgB [Methylobacterium]ACA18054.1 flagellar basal body rod protein [Methylobacterium sp. 4-46]WFT77356.1 flagellar basal body rod protein FlgB [Methylobacterium nodulans]